MESVVVKKMILSFSEVFDIFRKDKMIILFSLLPIIIGIVLFSTVGAYIYTDGLSWGEKLIGEYISGETWGTFIKYILVALVTAGFYFLLSFFFVLIVSVIASPFNDIISKRTETILIGQKTESIDSSLKWMLTNFFKTIINEVKKISMIVIISLLALIMSFIPFLIPVGIILSSILMAVTFLDYSWSRHELSFRGCMLDTKKNVLLYGTSGAFFLISISIPLINLFALPIGVIYFTILYVKNNDNGVLISEENSI